MAEHAAPNRLIHEASPYLQQHAHNPVDWYPWGPEALAKAKAEDKPIFLSIGYSSCHWCHVMERESFENPEIAAVLNEHFVAIKVDREERPDLDQIYQTIAQIVTRHGGWPLSVWLTPDQKPFYVGTYYPPTERYGRPGFRQVLLSLSRAYREKRDEIAEVSENWTQALVGSEEGPEAPGDLPDRELFTHAIRQMARRFDRTHGGFAGAPKFPQPFTLDVMLRHWKQNDDREILDLVALTLRHMAEGGVYDQLGGGFHRYSVDEHWSVPHFEKMLYDNASLPPVYLAAWQATGEPSFRQIAEETLQYVMREMTHPEGGFYSTTDADSEGEEGKFFVFDRSDVMAATGPELGELMCRHYGVTDHGNFEDSGKTVLHIARTAKKLADELETPESEIRAALADGRRQMLAYREQRVPPFRDEKVLTAWNGLMISAFARAGRILRSAAYTDAARRAAHFVATRLTSPQGRLLRRYKDGDAAIPGYLEDYAYFAAALIDLYEASFDEAYLEQAIHYTREALRLFYDGRGDFYLTPAGGEALIHRPKDSTDSSTPAASSVMALNLLRLLPFTGDESFREIAEAFLRTNRALAQQYPSAMGSYLQVLDLYLDGPTEITLVGDAPEEWLTRLGRRYLPNLVLTQVAEGQGGRPIWEGKAPQGDLPTVYICRDFACSPPATEWTEAEAHLSQ